MLNAMKTQSIAAAMQKLMGILISKQTNKQTSPASY